MKQVSLELGLTHKKVAEICRVHAIKPVAPTREQIEEICSNWIEHKSVTKVVALSPFSRRITRRVLEENSVDFAAHFSVDVTVEEKRQAILANAAQIKELRSKGASYNAIAKELGLSSPHVKRFVVSGYDLNIYSRPPKISHPVFDDLDPVWVTDQLKIKSIRQLAEELNVSPSGLGNFMVRHSINERRHSESV